MQTVDSRLANKLAHPKDTVYVRKSVPKEGEMEDTGVVARDDEELHR